MKGAQGRGIRAGDLPLIYVEWFADQFGGAVSAAAAGALRFDPRFSCGRANGKKSLR